MTNIQAALGVAQLERIEEIITRKRQIGEKYQELLADINSINLPKEETSFAKNIYWVFALTLADEVSRNAHEIMAALGKRGVGTRPFFYPMHKQPVFKKMGLFANEKYPNAEKLYNRGFYIPSGLGITDQQIEAVAKTIKEVVL